MINFLKRLELQGFKSFASKTTIDFVGKVTAIVGPNGSGKSNIIDALRWTLGEREAKQLRGETIENLIFAGTPKRPAVGMARVGLYFDNKNRELPIDAEEVVLQRKVDRTGVSEFTINEAEMKLKDILPMLAKAKVGTKGLTMIGQGQGDLVTRSTPEERRAMIEEILGLREFRIKKGQSERRLLTTKINVEKVKATIEELLPHLKFLRRQKHHWERRSEVEKTLEALENQYLVTKYHELHLKENETSIPERSLEETYLKKKFVVEKEEQTIKELNTFLDEREKNERIRKELVQLSDVAQQLERELIRIEMRIEVEKARGREPKAQTVSEFQSILQKIKEEIETVLKEENIAECKKRMKEWRDKIHILLQGNERVEKETDKLRELQEQKTKTHAKTEQMKHEIQELRKKEEEQRVREYNASKEFRERTGQLESHRNELREIERQIRDVKFEREKIQMRKDELKHQWISFGRKEREIENIVSLASHTARENSNEENTYDMERRMLKLRGELASIGEIDPGTIKEAEETEKRHEFLARELQDLEEAAKNLEIIIKELEKKIHEDFKKAFATVNNAFKKYFELMFNGGHAKFLLVQKEQSAEAEEQTEEKISAPNEEGELQSGIEIELTIPKKKINNLEMLSGGEKSLVSLAALFALISVSPPPFLVLDEIDAPLDEANAKKFANLVKEFSKKTQFMIITHNRVTMEAADVLYGVTMGDDGVSKILSLKLNEVKAT